MNPKGKTAFVTASARRIGKAITLGLAQAGANVVINYRTSSETADATAAEARALGVEAMTVQFDVSDYRKANEVVAKVQDKFGGIDILVNNASMFTKDPFPTQDFTIWHRTIDILVHAPFYLANAVAPLMQEKGEGTIVNIVDLGIMEAWPNLTAHCVGKSALLALARQLALELAPAIRVNTVVPGPILPPLNYDDEKIARTAEKTLLNRWGTPDDIAETVLFLIRSNYITAELIIVDGGERIAHRKYEEG